MSKSYPWFKFNPADWLTDIDLRSCSCAARGTLVDLMCLAHRNENYGTFMSEDTPKERRKIAKSLSISIRTFDKHLSDLLHMSRICLSDDGHMYIKRMQDDHAKADKDSENGSKGGNPAIVGVNPEVDKSKKKSRVDKKKSTPNPKKKLTVTQKAERIYKEYPKKVGRAKAITSIVAALNNGADANIVINAVIAYGKATKTWPAEDKQYIPNPATWFNQERWTDDQDEWRSKAQVVTGAEYVVATQGDG